MQVDSRRRESTQTTILALLLAQKGGCTLRQLDKDYYELEGEHIPWREFGYTSLLSFLHSMSKTVKLEDRDNTTIVKGIASEKSKHVSKLVAGQKETKQPTGRKTYKPSHYYPRTAPQRIHIRAEVLSSIVTLIENHPEGLHKNYLFQRVQACMPFTNITISDMEEQLQELSHIIFQNNNKFYSVEHKVTNSNDHGKNKDIPCLRVHSPVEEKPKSSVVTVAGDEDYDDILDYDDEDISEFMPSNKKPTSCYRKNSVSKGQDQVADCKPLVQTAHSELDNLHISKHNDNYETMTEFNNNVNEHKEQCLNSNDVEILINERLKFRLEKLIQNHPNGIWCADLPEKYLEEYKVPLNYIELGFNSVREFAAELPHIFHCIQPHDKGDFMLHYAKKKVPLNEVKEKPTTQNLAQLYQIYETPNDEALPVTVSLNTCKELIPDDVMSIGESVGHLSVTDFDQMDQPYIEVVVVEVFTPSFFWIQLRKQQNIFKKFMDDLHIFYTTNTEQYTIPPVVLEKGLNCACLYNGIWHRGIIKTVKPDLQVTVMFYDYGTLKTYSPDEVYYLHRKFSYLPAQAIPCGLVNVKPYRGSKWSRSVTHSFAVRTSQAPLIATIALINSEDNSMMVTLTDTLEEEDVHINDWLVEQKLAEHGRMVCTKKRNFPFHYYLQCRERFTQKYEVSGIDKMEISSKDGAALYNFNSENALFDNDSNKMHNSKAGFLSESNEELKFANINNSRENDISIGKTVSSTQTFDGRTQTRLQFLYEKLLTLKRKSTRPINNINDGNINTNETAKTKENLDPSLSSNGSIKQKLHANTAVLRCHAVECKNTEKCDASSQKPILVSYEKDSEVSEENCNILQRCSNIPKQYANHFDIQDPEDELDIGCMKNLVQQCNEDKIEHKDWSLFWKNAVSVKERASETNKFKIPDELIFKNKDNIPFAENCFLQAVYNSSCYADSDDKLSWSPTGNINEVHDVSSVILRDIRKHARCMKNFIRVGISQKILETLTGKTLEETFNTFNLNERQNSIALQENNNIRIEKPDINNDKLSIKDSDMCSKDLDENNYIFVKTCTSGKQLLEKLLLMDEVSNTMLDLDSDDLSASEQSISEDIDKQKSNNFSTEMNTDCVSHSVNSDTIDTCTGESGEASYDKLCKKHVTENKLLNAALLNGNIRDVVNLTTTESLSSEEIQNAQINPYKGTISSNIRENSEIPIFNDNDMETYDGEWDVQISHSDLQDLFKGTSSCHKDMVHGKHFEEPDSRLSIVEIGDSDSIMDTNHVETCETANDDICHVTYSSKTLDYDDEHEKSDTRAFSNNSLKSLKTNNECISNTENAISPMTHKLQSKSKTLVEMLNKVKLLKQSD